ncbi:hypothetical protein ACFVFH_20610 [Streptomyces sp. NPDC057697]|uniref:hypothetical protein n=1 Tax=Streptomyces sp. NPDC057697 TaxID=3346219 RepID=UPI003692C429
MDKGTVLELLPGTGVLLPDGAGVLRFGTGAEATRDLLTATASRVHPGMRCGSLTLKEYSELRHAHDAWLGGYLFQPDWNTVAHFDGLRLLSAGGGPDAADALARIEVWREPPSSEAAGTAVVWDGVDLFGHPAEETLRVLPEAVRLPGPRTDATVPALGLRLEGDGAAGTPWRRLSMAGPEPDGWGRCCGGRSRCARGGDGMVGLMR